MTTLPLDMSMWAGSEDEGLAAMREGGGGEAARGGVCGVLTSHKYFSTCT